MKNKYKKIILSILLINKNYLSQKIINNNLKKEFINLLQPNKIVKNNFNISEKLNDNHYKILNINKEKTLLHIREFQPDNDISFLEKIIYKNYNALFYPSDCENTKVKGTLQFIKTISEGQTGRNIFYNILLSEIINEDYKKIPVGFISFDTEKKIISKLAIDNNYQGRNFGSYLVRYALFNYFIKENLKYISLETTSVNVGNFYEKIGFQSLKFDTIPYKYNMHLSDLIEINKHIQSI